MSAIPYPPTPSAVERARSAGPSLRPSGLKETAGRHDGCSLQAVDLKTFRYIGPQGRSLKATGVATSSDKLRQVATSSDKLRQVATSCDYYRPVGQGTLTESCDRQGSLGGPGTFRKKHQTTVTHPYRVPGPSGHARRVLRPSGNSARRPETKAKSSKS